jgi:sugar phosphate isomerase/epimerase
MSRHPARLGVCSWSLRPSSPAELAAEVAACGLSAVQLALEPLRSGAWSFSETRDTLERAGIALLSGMFSTRGEDYSTLASIRATGGVRPDAHWEANRRAARETAALAARFGLGLVSFHAGFLPETAGDPERVQLVERLRVVADLFAAEGVRIALETGQESAETLLAVLAELERPEVGVNFDPANMLLYGTGDPVAALRALAPRVLQVHLKDALRSNVPGEWGTEVPLGQGAVDWPAFFAVLAELRLDCDLVIEREAGAARIADVRAARALAVRLDSRPRTERVS